MHTPKIRLRLTCLALLFTVAGCGRPPGDTAETPQAILGGTPVPILSADAELFVQILLGKPASGVCSGTLLMNDWVLTAAHCLAQWTSNPGALQVFSTNNAGVQRFFDVDQVLIHPSYLTQSYPYFEDVGLIHLKDTPVTLAHPFWEARLYDGATNIGTTLHCFGWGWNSYADVNAQPGDLSLREAFLPVTALAYTGYQLGFNGNGQITAPGDSGGPCFWESAGQRYLTGVHSYQTNDTAGNIQSTHDQEIGSALSWILPTIAASSITDAGYPNMMRANADVNGDGVLDYCRFVGTPPGVFLSCQLGLWSGSWNGSPRYYRPNPYEFNSVQGIDPGYAGTQFMRDVNGDGRADFCRTVGNPGATWVACDYATAFGFARDTLTACPRSCAGKACGDDGCGGSCGTCTGSVCTNSQCICTPSCGGNTCGSDGCSGSCGTCPHGSQCSAGQCTPVACTPSCSGKRCGAGDGCGGQCSGYCTKRGYACMDDGSGPYCGRAN